MKIEEQEYIAHYGILRKSGRYPWGSGDDEGQRNKDFLAYVDDLHKQGLTDVQIAEGIGISTTQLRASKSIAKNQQKQSQISYAQSLRDKGMSNVAIGRQMGVNESVVRSLLAPGQKEKQDILLATSAKLKMEVDEKTYLDVGAGVENHMGISATKLNTAVAVLREQGYEVHSIPVPQLGTGKNTTTKVLAPEGTTWGDVVKNRDQIQLPYAVSEDGGRTYLKLQKPLSIDQDRIGIRYKEDGGADADGVIYVRPGVKDISLDGNQYAQVRIQVGDGHYLKGMAMYKDDLPKGVDLQFNTNKSDTGNKLDAMKALEKDPDRPFGAVIKRQVIEVDADGTQRVTSAMNILHEEGNWSDWSRTISTQMLSKQNPSLVKSQLDMTYERREREFKELSALTNPTVRKKLLEDFGDQTSSAAVHLDAAELNTRQGWHAILPVSSLPPTQIYAPNFRDGETVVLVRFPHSGTFEIPELTVNNSHPESRKLLGSARDAVGIHHSVAERLSGADFDGDTVLVIPNNSRKIKSTPALEGLKGFDPRTSYPAYPGMPKMTSRQKGIEMGGVSNLITDMTLKGANEQELARAVRHSMVVIDAEKHHLNYKESAIRNNIPQLKEKYQGKSNAGANTLISRATAETRVNERKARPAAQGGAIDKETGKRVFVDTGRIDNRNGQLRKERSTKLAETDDAHTLSSGTRVETMYADHSNKLKALGDRARLESTKIPRAKQSPSAKKIYEPQVKSLNAQLDIAQRNAPLERRAQILANSEVKAKRAAKPEMDNAELKKVKAQALNTARIRTGASKTRVEISEKEWEAIQAGAISDSKLTTILSNADMDTVRALATPKSLTVMTSSMTKRAQSMLNSGYTRAQVADQLGVSLTTLDTVTEAD